MPTTFVKRLLAWYTQHQRALPWRGESDPYRVWVSEIMLQQTQVETVRPYYERWLQRFPTVAALAAASEQEVLALWEGLGYYSRVRNLWKAAQQVQQMGGQLPRTVPELRALPGIGRYTAGAIASMAFGADAAVLDGNVKRVLARVFDVATDGKSPAGERELWALAESLIPPGQAGDYNQALMDLGSTVCTPRSPTCLLCPVQSECRAFALGIQHLRPVVRPRAPLPHETWPTGVIRKGTVVLVVQRPPEGLLANLWAFPAVRGSPHVDSPVENPRAMLRALRQTLEKDWRLNVTLHLTPLLLTHTFTHLQVTIPVFEGEWRSGRLPRNSGAQWVSPEKFGDFPMGKTDRQIAKWVIQP